MKSNVKQGTNLETRIVYEDNHLIAINKLPGELVQGDKTGDPSLLDTISEFIKLRDKKPGNVFLGPCHRLDRPTSGIVVFAKTSKALSRMNKLFSENKVKKIYWAVIPEQPENEEGVMEDLLVKNEKQNKSMVIRPDRAEKRNAKKARLQYRLAGKSAKYYLMEVLLETGRHHQIRAQFAKRGYHIRGDLKYGYPRSNRDGGIHLHSRSLGFTHPTTKEEMVIHATPPREALWDYFKDIPVTLLDKTT
jgi:23S rRNA pseudouridine1911/1915/1917 synthase